MKILCANPPWSKKGYFGVRAGSRWPHFEKEDVDYQPFPFFLAIATSLLNKNGFEARIIDSLALRESDSEFVDRVIDFNPDIVFFEISTPSLDNDILQANRLLDRFGQEVRFIFGGLHKPAQVKNLFDKFTSLDVFIHGEYEETLLDVVSTLNDKNTDLRSIDGISFRDQFGKIITTAKRDPIDDLDRLPWPDYSQLPLHRYHDACGGLPKPSLQLWASRGCPYGCIFCAWPQIMYGGRNYRVRNPVKVVDELEYLIDRYGFKSAYFDDDTFNIGDERVQSIAQEIGRRKLDIQWGVMARADTMERETLQIMVENGLRAIKYGVESGNQRIIDNSGKRLRLDKVRETIRWTRELDLKYHLSFAFGLPGENEKTIKETVQLALELDPTSIQFSLITPFPGSEYYFSLKENGYLVSDDWSCYDGYTTAVVKTDTLESGDLEKALDYAEAEWRKHLAKRLLRQGKIKAVSHALRHPKQVLNFLRSLKY